MSSGEGEQFCTSDSIIQPLEHVTVKLEEIDSDDLSSLSSEDDWPSSDSLTNLDSESSDLDQNHATGEDFEDNKEALVVAGAPGETLQISQSLNKESQQPPPKRTRFDVYGSSNSAWDWISRSNVSQSFPAFDSSDSGLNNSTSFTEDSKEIDYFEAFIDKEVVEFIVKETNDYYKYLKENYPPKPNSRLAIFEETNTDEIRLFLCILILMGQNKKNRIHDYWSTDEIYEQKIFGRLMSRDRFLQLLRLIHFTGNNKRSKIEKIKPILDLVKNKFKSIFVPFQDLCIHESLSWEGKLESRQHIPSKRRFGIKAFVLCDSVTGYIVDIIAYCGKGTELEIDRELGITGSIATSLLKDFMHKGHILYCDNWYTSPDLFKKLLKNKTGACGIVREDRKNMPKFDTIGRGEVTHATCNNILCVKWRDKRNVHMLTSVHDEKMGDSGKKDRHGNAVHKPKAVIEYNKKMRILEKSDMLLSGIEFVRKIVRWYKTFFFHLVDLSLLNAFYMFKYKKGEKKSFLDFSKSVVTQMTAKYKRKTIINGHIGARPLRLVGRHFIKPLNSRRRCHVCAHTKKGLRKQQRTSFTCEECDVPLCVFPCFKKFHTEKEF